MVAVAENAKQVSKYPCSLTLVTNPSSLGSYCLLITSSAKTKEVKPPSDENHYRVKRGDTLWNVAKNNLVAAGKNGITKDDMNAEMERIAKLNGFESVDEFRDKFFGHGSGKEFLVKQPAQQNNKGTELNYTPMDDGGVCK